MFGSIVELQEAINRYIAEHNDDPAPFVWTKTADQITTKLDRLNASVHWGLNDHRLSDRHDFARDLHFLLPRHSHLKQLDAVSRGKNLVRSDAQGTEDVRVSDQRG